MNYQKVNAVTKVDADPVSDPQAIFATLADSIFFLSMTNAE